MNLLLLQKSRRSQWESDYNQSTKASTSAWSTTEISLSISSISHPWDRSWWDESSWWHGKFNMLVVNLTSDDSYDEINCCLLVMINEGLCVGLLSSRVAILFKYHQQKFVIHFQGQDLFLSCVIKSVHTTLSLFRKEWNSISISSAEREIIDKKKAQISQSTVEWSDECGSIANSAKKTSHRVNITFSIFTVKCWMLLLRLCPLFVNSMNNCLRLCEWIVDVGE
jgi:hypothetical protein